MAGEETIARGKSDSENFSETSERVRFLPSGAVLLMRWTFSEKRALAQKAEADFFALLRESGVAQDGAVWKEAGNCLVQPFNSSDVTFFALRLRKKYLRIPATMPLVHHLYVRSYLTPS
jgi:hypothetical protein